MKYVNKEPVAGNSATLPVTSPKGLGEIPVPRARQAGVTHGSPRKETLFSHRLWGRSWQDHGEGGQRKEGLHQDPSLATEWFLTPEDIGLALLPPEMTTPYGGRLGMNGLG